MKLQGEKNRHFAETKMNDRSSRSHTIFRVALESINRPADDTMGEEEEAAGDEAGQHVMMSYLNLVDLAGSEKAGQTGAEGARLVVVRYLKGSVHIFLCGTYGKSPNLKCPPTKGISFSGHHLFDSEVQKFDLIYVTQ